jgi:hypothetical protein
VRRTVIVGQPLAGGALAAWPHLDLSAARRPRLQPGSGWQAAGDQAVAVRPAAIDVSDIRDVDVGTWWMVGSTK